MPVRSGTSRSQCTGRRLRMRQQRTQPCHAWRSRPQRLFWLPGGPRAASLRSACTACPGRKSPRKLLRAWTRRWLPTPCAGSPGPHRPHDVFDCPLLAAGTRLVQGAAFRLYCLPWWELSMLAACASGGSALPPASGTEHQPWASTHVALCLLQACLVAGMTSWCVIMAGNPEPVRTYSDDYSGCGCCLSLVLLCTFLHELFCFVLALLFLKHTALDRSWYAVPGMQSVACL